MAASSPGTGSPVTDSLTIFKVVLRALIARLSSPPSDDPLTVAGPEAGSLPIAKTLRSFRLAYVPKSSTWAFFSILFVSGGVFSA